MENSSCTFELLNYRFCFYVFFIKWLLGSSINMENWFLISYQNVCFSWHWYWRWDVYWINIYIKKNGIILVKYTCSAVESCMNFAQRHLTAASRDFPAITAVQQLPVMFPDPWQLGPSCAAFQFLKSDLEVELASCLDISILLHLKTLKTKNKILNIYMYTWCGSIHLLQRWRRLLDLRIGQQLVLDVNPIPVVDAKE